jgi:hypothetical protein
MFTTHFSTCAQQPKFAMKLRPLKKPEFLRKRPKNDQNQRLAQSESVLVEEDYGLSPSSDLYSNMTYDSEELNRICFDVDYAERSKWHMKEIVFHLSNE